MRPTVVIGIITGLACLALIGGGLLAFRYARSPEPPPALPAPPVQGAAHSVIGTSVEGRKIEAYTYGAGKTHVVFVGGIHGGYEWNGVLVAYQLKDYLDAHLDAVPSNESITIILDANPDAMFKAVSKEGRFDIAAVPKGDLSAERFNAHGVDLNRNFDCEWAPTGTWQNKTVSGGTEAFSEPEAKAIRDYALEAKPNAFVFWHSAAGGVYSSECGKGILPVTLEMMHAYAEASGYKAFEHFDSYVVHGASEDWLASIGIPAITVELQTHDSVEWDKNLLGVQAIVRYFSAGATSQ